MIQDLFKPKTLPDERQLVHVSKEFELKITSDSVMLAVFKSTICDRVYIFLFFERTTAEVVQNIHKRLTNRNIRLCTLRYFRPAILSNKATALITFSSAKICRFYPMALLLQHRMRWRWRWRE